MFEHGLAQESFKKAFLERTRKGGFGSTAKRTFIFHNKESIGAPSPGQYQVKRSISVVIHFFSFYLSLELKVLIVNRLKYYTQRSMDSLCRMLYRVGNPLKQIVICDTGYDYKMNF